MLAAGRPSAVGCVNSASIDEVLPTSGLGQPELAAAGWIGGGGHIAVNLHGNGPLSHRVLMTTAPMR